LWLWHLLDGFLVVLLHRTPAFVVPSH